MTLVSISSNPIPENPDTGIIVTPDGVRLRYACWSSSEARNGTVCIFTGRGECIEKYFETISELRARGFAVAIMDWRGQGRSSRQLANHAKGHVRDFTEYEIDVDAFMQHIVLAKCPKPYVALAHSMGGAAMLRVAHAGKAYFEGMVLCAPLIDLPSARASRPLRWLTRALVHSGMGEHFVSGGKIDLAKADGFPTNRLTSDPSRYQRNAAIVKAEPSLAISAPTLAWLNAVFDTIAGFRNAEYARAISQPVLMVGCGRDSIVSTPAIAAFARRLPRGSYVEIPAAKHELLHERNEHRNRFWAAFDEFIATGLSRSGS